MGRLASRQSSPLPVHLKIDTGMDGRLSPAEARSLLRSDWPASLQLEGIAWVHLGSTDGNQRLPAQLTEFREVLADIRGVAGGPTDRAHITPRGARSILHVPGKPFRSGASRVSCCGYAPRCGSSSRAPARTDMENSHCPGEASYARPGVSYGRTFIAKRPTTLASPSRRSTRTRIQPGRVNRGPHSYSRPFSPGRWACLHGSYHGGCDRCRQPSLRALRRCLSGQRGSRGCISADDLATEIGTIGI